MTTEEQAREEAAKVATHSDQCDFESAEDGLPIYKCGCIHGIATALLRFHSLGRSQGIRESAEVAEEIITGYTPNRDQLAKDIASAILRLLPHPPAEAGVRP
jgi:hypothetical protein